MVILTWSEGQQGRGQEGWGRLTNQSVPQEGRGQEGWGADQPGCPLGGEGKVSGGTLPRLRVPGMDAGPQETTALK